MNDNKYIVRSFDDNIKCAYQKSDNDLKISLYLVRENNKNGRILYLNSFTFESKALYDEYLSALERYNFCSLKLSNGMEYSYSSDHYYSTYLIKKDSETNKNYLSFIYVLEKDDYYDAVYYSSVQIDDVQNEEYYLENMGFTPYNVFSDIALNREKKLIK